MRLYLVPLPSTALILGGASSWLALRFSQSVAPVQTNGACIMDKSSENRRFTMKLQYKYHITTEVLPFWHAKVVAQDWFLSYI